MERAKRIELSSQPWQGRVLPLNHARINLFTFNTNSITNFFNAHNYFFFAAPKEVCDARDEEIFCRFSICGWTPNRVVEMFFK